LRVAAEASERVGPARVAEIDAAPSGRGADGLALRPSAAPGALWQGGISEGLVADHEEGVDAEHVPVERGLREGGVLDQLSRIPRVEHAVEVLARAEIGGGAEARDK